jgi:hypothetical protein
VAPKNPGLRVVSVTRGAPLAAVTTERAPEVEQLARHLRFLADHLGPRPVGSAEASRGTRYLRDAIVSLGFTPEVQAFSVSLRLGRRAHLRNGDGRSLPCQAALGSFGTRDVLRGVPRLLTESERRTWPAAVAPANTFAVCPIDRDGEAAAVTGAVQRGASAVLLYREGTPELYAAAVPNGGLPVPCVTVRPADGLQLVAEARVVELRVETERLTALGENLIVQFGHGGRPLLFLANYDSRPGTPGAYQNGSGVVALLGLLTRLRGWRGHEVLVGFLDGDDPAAAGSRHCRDVVQATHVPPSLRGIVYVSAVGMKSLAVVPGDSRKSPQLAEVVRRAVTADGLPLGEPGVLAAHAAAAARLWECPLVTLTGPRLPLEHTGLDRPDLVSPRGLARVVSVLERLARIPDGPAAATERGSQGGGG